jgi:ubiquinone/menaquinone biosynthesis C-methylase UbiE
MPRRRSGWSATHYGTKSMSTEKRNFDKEAPTWDQEPRRLKLAGEVARAIAEAVQPSLETNVLDFGCGTGLLTLQLQPLVGSITGIDSSQGMLDVLASKVKAQNLTNVRTRCLDLDKGDKLEGTYDLVVSSMTLHHIQDIASVLAQFSRVLRPAGHLCVADLDPDDGQFHSNNKGVFHNGFPQSQLRQAFAQAGLVDVRYQTAAEVAKPVKGGEERLFTIFLMTGRK